MPLCAHVYTGQVSRDCRLGAAASYWKQYQLLSFKELNKKDLITPE